MKYHHQPYFPAVIPLKGDGSFTQGFVASSCISAFQGVAYPDSKADLKRVLRHGLQGGTALAAGSRAAMALRHGDYSGALLATAAGAAGVLIIEKLLRDSAQPDQEEHHE
jgi:hypothetical protein